MLYLGKLKLYLIILAGIALILGSAYLYYKDTQEKLQIAAQNSAKLEMALDVQIQTTSALKQDIKNMNTSLRLLNDEFDKSRLVVSDLTNALNVNSDGSRRDIGKNAIADPQGVEEAINFGTEEVFSCISSLSITKGNDNDKNFIRCPDGSSIDRM